MHKHAKKGGHTRGYIHTQEHMQRGRVPSVTRGSLPVNQVLQSLPFKEREKPPPTQTARMSTLKGADTHTKAKRCSGAANEEQLCSFPAFPLWIDENETRRISWQQSAAQTQTYTHTFLYTNPDQSAAGAERWKDVEGAVELLARI